MSPATKRTLVVAMNEASEQTDTNVVHDIENQFDMDWTSPKKGDAKEYVFQFLFQFRF